MTNDNSGAPAPSVFSFETSPIRAHADEFGELWFCAADVCKVLGYRNIHDAISKHCKEKGVAKRDTLTDGGNQELVYINEPNLYRLIIKSRKPEAERFEAWVMEEVLPTIRKTGTYQLAPTPEYVEHTHLETITLAMLQSSRFVLEFDPKGNMHLKEIPFDAFVTNLDSLPAMIADSGGPIRRSRLAAILQAVAKRMGKP